MSLKRQTLAYGTAAIIIAVIIIISSIVIGPLPISKTTSRSSAETSTSPTSGGSVPLLVQLTDPPNVPIGTQSLNMTYTNFALYASENGTQKQWLDTNSTGTVNLLSLVNISKTIGVTMLPKGSVVSQLRFNVTSVQINVNGTTYNAETTNNELVVPIISGAKLETLTSVLLELTPTVTEIITGSATTPSFVLIPSATAVIRQGSDVNQSQASLGVQSGLTANDRAQLEDAAGNASILGTNLSVSGNRTTFSMTIKNSGNVSVALGAVSLQGQFNVSSSIGSSTCSSTSTSTSPSESGSTDSGSNSCTTSEQEVEYPDEVVFTANGSSLVQVSSNEGVQNTGAPVLQPGQTVTLSFNGVIVLMRDDSQNLHTILALPILGNTYSVYAGFSNSAGAVVQVNSTPT